MLETIIMQVAEMLSFIYVPLAIFIYVKNKKKDSEIYKASIFKSPLGLSSVIIGMLFLGIYYGSTAFLGLGWINLPATILLILNIIGLTLGFYGLIKRKQSENGILCIIGIAINSYVCIAIFEFIIGVILLMLGVITL